MVKAAERIGRRHPLNLRTTEDLRRKLEESASLSGRSLTAETEHRLLMSFEWERAFADYEAYKAKFRKELDAARQGEIERIMRESGWNKVVDPRYGGRVWLPPGRMSVAQSGFGEADENTVEAVGSAAPHASSGSATAAEEGTDTMSASAILEEVVERAVKRALAEHFREAA